MRGSQLGLSRSDKGEVYREIRETDGFMVREWKCSESLAVQTVRVLAEAVRLKQKRTEKQLVSLVIGTEPLVEDAPDDDAEAEAEDVAEEEAADADEGWDGDSSDGPPPGRAQIGRGHEPGHVPQQG